MDFTYTFDPSSAYDIIRLKGYTSWAIGLCCAHLCEALLHDRNIILPLSVNVKVSTCLL